MYIEIACRNFERYLSRYYEIPSRNYEMASRNYETVSRYYEIITHTTLHTYILHYTYTLHMARTGDRILRWKTVRAT